MKPVTETLKTLIANHGENIIDQPQRLKAMLADLLPHEKRMRYLLEVSLRAEIPKKLTDIQQDEKEVQDTKTNALKHYFKEEYFLEDNAVKSVFDCWIEVVKSLLENSVIYSEPVTDIDGNVYNTEQIGNQVWMAENLRVSRYRNGDLIPNVQNNEEWSNMKNGAWCNYENNPENDLLLGKLYNGYCVLNKHELAPKGWHIANDKEWETMINTLCWRKSENIKLNEKGILLWKKLKTVASSEIIFSTLPSGTRSHIGKFDSLQHTFWWSLRRNDINDLRVINHRLTEYLMFSLNILNGLPIRCIKDEKVLIDTTFDFSEGEYIDEFGVKYNAAKTKLVKAPLSLKDYTILPITKVICDEAFCGCDLLEEIQIPNSILLIGTKTFYKCSNLKIIHLPDNLIEIGSSTFQNCSNLKSINIPESLTSVGYYTFFGCDFSDELKKSIIQKFGFELFSDWVCVFPF